MAHFLAIIGTVVGVLILLAIYGVNWENRK
jgi:hypothetical protein